MHGVSTLSAAPAALLLALVDDAAMFPPGNASAAEAIAAHLDLRSGRHAFAVGPLLVPAAQWEQFRVAHDAAGLPRLDVVLVGAVEAPIAPSGPLRVVGFETTVSTGELPEAQQGLPLAVEPADPASGEQVLHAIGERRCKGAQVIGKFRTGGTSNDAFCSEAQLAQWVIAAFRAGVPFKLTAGLHHAVRHSDASTGFEHHGYLNVLVATRVAIIGGGVDAVIAALAERSSETLTAQVSTWAEHEVACVRSVFTSFGCCGVLDPIGDALALGLLVATPS